MEQNINPRDYRFFSFISLFFLVSAWLPFGLVLLGIFSFGLLLPLLAASVSIFGYLGYRHGFFSGTSRNLRLALLIILGAAILFTSFSTPTIFSGRDQGSLSEAAIRLAQNRKLEFTTPASQSFFGIYGPGKALNFPGFHYTATGDLITQFPLVYTAWLAMFFSFFGLLGLKIANVILFFFFAASFFLLYTKISNRRWGLLFLGLILSTFVFSWIAKLTLSENVALALLWIGILEIVLFRDGLRVINYSNALLAFSLLFFSRLEGIFFFPIFLTVLFFSARSSEFWQSKKREKMLIPALFFLLLAIANLDRDFYFYKEIGKTLFGSGKNIPGSIFNIGAYLSHITYTGKIFALYGTLVFSLLGLWGIGYFLKKKNYSLLIPFFITLPSFIYLLDPNISADHPWMLRRFVFSILPTLLLFSVLFLERFGEEKKKTGLVSVALGVLILFNLYPFGKYVSFSENRGLLEQTEEISRRFSEKDLILVDRLSSGNGCAMLTGPLNFTFGKGAVYFFNPNDLAKLNPSSFEKIYLIIPEDKIDFYRSSVIGPRLGKSEEYALETNRLDANEMIRLPEKKTVSVRGRIFEITK